MYSKASNRISGHYAMQAGLANRQFTFRDVFTFFFAIIWIEELKSKLNSGLDLLGITYLIHS